ncbi:hypothetical protein HA466_0205210 [Hirschfeldia incana]|nr:hypothetical protein HA466_0205210 [Hirschfeldia incana]
MLILPLCLPGLAYPRNWYLHNVHSSFRLEGSGFILVDVDELEIHKGMATREASLKGYQLIDDDVVRTAITPDPGSCCSKLVTRNQLGLLGEEHPLYLSIATTSDRLQQSLGQSSETTTLVTLYSSFSFFGRLLSSTPDYIRAKFYFARTWWLTVALLPTTVALFLLVSSGSLPALQAETALIGLSSGFIFAAAVCDIVTVLD